MFANQNLKGLEKDTVRCLFEQDLTEGAPIFRRSLVLAAKLISACPRALQTPSGPTLCGHTPVDFVCAAVDVMLTAKRRVYTLRGGLLGTVRHLVAEACASEPEDALLCRVSARLRSVAAEDLPAGFLRLFDPDLVPVVIGMLAGRSLRAIQLENGMDVIEVLALGRRVRAIARVVLDRDREPVA